VLLLLVAWHLRAARPERRLERIHRQRMMALEKGIPLPELPEQDEPARRPGIGNSAAALGLSPEDDHSRVCSFGPVDVGASRSRPPPLPARCSGRTGWERASPARGS
jgi:hypothetical protein